MLRFDSDSKEKLKIQLVEDRGLDLLIQKSEEIARGYSRFSEIFTGILCKRGNKVVRRIRNCWSPGFMSFFDKECVEKKKSFKSFYIA